MKKLEKRNPEQPRKCRVGTQTKSVILRRRVSADEGTYTQLSNPGGVVFGESKSCLEDQKQKQTAKLVHGGSVCLTLLLLLALVTAGCIASKASTDSPAPSGNALVAAKTTANITIDGRADEKAWQAAAETTTKLSAEPGVEPKAITLRALYDKDNIYLSAKYKDSTPLKIGETWVFDGTGWTKGPFDDSLAFVWNMNDSVKGFDANGMKVMTKPLVNGTDIYDFAIDPAKSDYCTAKDVNQKADVWGWCGMPEFYGKADDMVLMKSAEPSSVLITVQHDAFTNIKPWVKNETVVNGKPVPLYKYKEGLNLANTPRPYMEDIETITDYSTFKAGDQAPYVVGIKGATWGGSKDDITVKGARSGSDWSVEFSRKLDTGHSDDIKPEPGKTATFAIIIRDDSKGYAISKPVTLRLE